MTLANIEFLRLEQHMQYVGNHDECMLSTVHFTVVIDGENFLGEAGLKQAAGSDYATAPLEVTACTVAFGDWVCDRSKLGAGLERYYRKMIGQNASAISFPPGTNVEMSGNTIVSKYTGQIEVHKRGSAGW